MKRLFTLALSATILLSLAGCGSSGTAATSDAGSTAPITAGSEASSAPEEIGSSLIIKTQNGNKEEIELEVPYNPTRIAVMDLGALDILDKLELGDRIVGVSKGSSIEYLQGYVNDNSLMDLGTIKQANLEGLLECDPELIFIGGRLLQYYDELIKIAPVICLSTDSSVGVVESTSRNAMMIASIFGIEDQVSDVMAVYDDRIKTLSEFSAGKTAVVGMVNAGGFGTLGNDGRCSIIGVEIGFDNLANNAASNNSGSDNSQRSGNSDGGENTAYDSGTSTASHGNEASFEILVALNPEYIFIMDRDAAIGTDGAQLAKDVMDNEVVALTDAYQNDNIIVLEHSNVWYTAEGGITALGIMLEDLETALF